MGVTFSYGAAPTYVEIASYTAGSSQNSYTFTNIPQTYTDLVMVSSGVGSATGNLECYINGDTNNRYSFNYVYGDGSSAAAGKNADTTRVVVGRLGSAVSHGIAHFQNYSNTSTFKNVLTKKGKGDEITMLFANVWMNTAAITSLQVFGESAKTMSAGYTITLYGIKAASVETRGYATGGTLFSDATYYYHVFKQSDVFIPTKTVSADILQIAGGGGGGYRVGGGGGAGGLLAFTSQSLTAATRYTCVVGAGGIGGLTSGGNGNSGGGTSTNGSNSQFASLTASVGGGGGGGLSGSGATGGSGGGGSYFAGAGSNTSGQGFAGGAAVDVAGGGGGGAGAVGQASYNGGANYGIPGAGGAGLNTYSSWASATSTGVNGYYAGGGGGGVLSQLGGAQVVGGNGGAGGGGKGGSLATTGGVFIVPTPGRGSTGSGGGGGSDYKQGANGGSGIIIVRYAK